jgi:hypothetical protein
MRIFPWLFAAALTLSVSGAELQFNFADYPEGATPTNFHSALAGSGLPAHWKIVTDEVPPLLAPLTDKAPVTRRGVLAQASEDMTDERFPMFIYDGETFRDFKFSTRFKIVSGITEQMAGVVFRFQNTSNFYVVRVSSLGHNVRFYKVVNGQRSDPIGPLLDVPLGTWHTLGVRCEGNQISIFLDDHLVMPPLGDNTFTEGKLGFWTKSDAVSYFADGRMTYTPRIPAAQQLVDNLMEKQPLILGVQIFTLQTSNTTRIIASKDHAEIGLAGTDVELQTLTDGITFFGRDRGVVMVALPLRDRNGESIAALRVKLKSYFTETQDAAVTRALMIRKKLEELCTSAEDLNK